MLEISSYWQRWLWTITIIYKCSEIKTEVMRWIIKGSGEGNVCVAILHMYIQYFQFSNDITILLELLPISIYRELWPIKRFVLRLFPMTFGRVNVHVLHHWSLLACSNMSEIFRQQTSLYHFNTRYIKNWKTFQWFFIIVVSLFLYLSSPYKIIILLNTSFRHRWM